MSVATIRMYNVGFGDCFLLRLTTTAGERTVLVDCGSHPKGQGPWPVLEVARRLVDDLGPADSRKIDVLVVTHRHADHISGFGPDVWSDLEVGEIWLPWIENPQDPEAKKIRDAQQNLAAALAGSAAAAATDGVLDLLANSVQNATAMHTIRERLACTRVPRYLPVSGKPESFESPLLPGVTVHALGPSHDANVIRDMDPPVGQSYLASLAGDVASSEALRPFLGGEPVATLSKDLEAVAKLADFDPFELAVALEDAVNGTSLMLALEIDSEVLLFPGDAQWGTWSVAMQDPASAALLRRTTFLKVGHHGSHNATPVDFVEKFLPDGIPAMCSTRHMDMWPNIPKTELMTRFGEKGLRVCRSDQPEMAPEGFTADPEGRWTEITI